MKAPHNGVRDHHRMDKTQHTGLVTVIVLSASGTEEEAHVCADQTQDQASDRLMICTGGVLAT